VHGDRIVSVGGTAPAGAQVIDLGEATLLPGFIDSHTHHATEHPLFVMHLGRIVVQKAGT